jgi:hypothetical protein
MRPVAERISAAQSNVHLVTVGETSRSPGPDTLASNTGSLTGLVSWANTGRLASAVAAPASYYRVTFAADDKAPSRPQRIDLRVHRSKVNVRTSPTIQIREAAAPRGQRQQDDRPLRVRRRGAQR